MERSSPPSQTNDVNIVVCRRQEHLPLERDDFLLLGRAQRADERLKNVRATVIVDERAKLARQLAVCVPASFRNGKFSFNIRWRRHLRTQSHTRAEAHSKSKISCVAVNTIARKTHKSGSLHKLT